MVEKGDFNADTKGGSAEEKYQENAHQEKPSGAHPDYSGIADFLVRWEWVCRIIGDQSVLLVVYPMATWALISSLVSYV